MKVKITFVILILYRFSVGFGQDTLFFKNGEKFEVKVLEVTQLNVRYLKWDYKDGPTFIVDKNDLLKIIYQNGSTDLFGKSSKMGNNEMLGKNIVGINPILLFSGSAIISYERFYKDFRRSVKIPLYLEFSNFEFYVGIELNYFVTKPSKARYFLGPAFKFGSDNVDVISSIYFNNGWSFQPTNKFNITINLGIGPTFSSESTILEFQTGLSLGLRF